eukprot:353857-Chlamydomonas_euryale.AAC.5
MHAEKRAAAAAAAAPPSGPGGVQAVATAPGCAARSVLRPAPALDMPEHSLASSPPPLPSLILPPRPSQRLPSRTPRSPWLPPAAHVPPTPRLDPGPAHHHQPPRMRRSSLPVMRASRCRRADCASAATRGSPLPSCRERGGPLPSCRERGGPRRGNSSGAALWGRGSHAAAFGAALPEDPAALEGTLQVHSMACIQLHGVALGLHGIGVGCMGLHGVA